MPDTPTPGSEWLLPVTCTGCEFGSFEFENEYGAYIWLLDNGVKTLIPASRLADLEAEVARLTDTLQMIEKFSDDSTSVEWANQALNPKD
jgi:hypothetical protein